MPINRIVTFVHCRRCADACKIRHTSPKEWARLEVGVTPEGFLQVWCLRHDIQVFLSDKPVFSVPPSCELCAAGLEHPKH